jgi:hypothetical protein
MRNENLKSTIRNQQSAIRHYLIASSTKAIRRLGEMGLDK